MKELQDDKFTVWMPFDEIIEKADKDGKKEMIIGGIASNSTLGEDAQGEILEVDGMDVAPFLKSGFINFNHQAGKDPSAIIGEPITAEKRDGKLHITAKLYAESSKARSIYELGQTLQKSSSSRRLGYSIEGKALERDPLKPGRILKSKIYHCAVTPSPICSGTEMQIMKGSIEDIKFDNVEDEFLVDVTGDDGLRRTVDKNFNIKVWEIEKAMEAGAITGRDTTNQDLTQEPLKKESIGAKKKKDKDKKRVLSKGETCKEILSTFKTTDVQLIKSLYEFIQSIDMEITSETIQKAKEILELVKSSDTTAATTQPATLSAEEIEKLKSDKQDFLTKAQEIEDKLKVAEAKTTPTAEEIQKAAAEELAKSAAVAPKVSDDLIKGLNDKIGALVTLYTEKSQENEELKKSFGELTAKVEELGKASNGPKSIISKSFTDRFAAVAADEKVLSISRDRRKLTATLRDLSNINKGEDVDQLLVKATSCMEIAGALGSTNEEAAQIAKRLKEKHKLIITA